MIASCLFIMEAHMLKVPITDYDRYKAAAGLIHLFLSCPLPIRRELQPLMTGFYQATSTELLSGNPSPATTDQRTRRLALVVVLSTTAPWTNHTHIALCWRTIASRLPTTIRPHFRQVIAQWTQLVPGTIDVTMSKTHRPEYLVTFRDTDESVLMSLVDLAKLVGRRMTTIRWYVRRSPSYRTRTKPTPVISTRGYHRESAQEGRDILITYQGPTAESPLASPYTTAGGPK